MADLFEKTHVLDLEPNAYIDSDEEKEESLLEENQLMEFSPTEAFLAESFSKNTFDILNEFEKHSYENMVELGDPMRIIEQDITDLGLNEDILYDFDRPEQSPDKPIRQLCDSIVTRPDSK